MVNRNLIRSLEDDDILGDLALLAPEDEAEEWLLDAIAAEQQDYNSGKIVDGRIVELNDEWALVDVGFKSEGT
ncbi:MAG: 30S ribosomal protein S1, partial [Rhodopirellula bahusiensis]